MAQSRETEPYTSRVNRRQLLRIGAVGAGALAIFGAMTDGEIDERQITAKLDKKYPLPPRTIGQLSTDIQDTASGLTDTSSGKQIKSAATIVAGDMQAMTKEQPIIKKRSVYHDTLINAEGGYLASRWNLGRANRDGLLALAGVVSMLWGAKGFHPRRIPNRMQERSPSKEDNSISGNIDKT